MSAEFPWTPSNLPEGSYIYGVCQACRERRYVTRAMMLERAGDVPFKTIESRLRCIARPQTNKPGPACGAQMTLELGGPRPLDQPANVQQWA
jgi:hypothetical protein